MAIEMLLPPTEPRVSHRPRIKAQIAAAGLGIVLIALSILCLYLFDRSARFVLSRTWAPALLGACFLGISGTFLIAQRRFSLSGIIVALMASAATTAGIQSFFTERRETYSICTEFSIPSVQHAAFIRRAQELLPPGRLEEVVYNGTRDGWLRGYSNLESASVRYNANPAPSPKDKDRVLVVLEFKCYPGRYSGGERLFAAYYAELAHYCVVHSLNAANAANISSNVSGSAKFVNISQLVGEVTASMGVIQKLSQWNPHPPQTQAQTLEWLRDNETNADLKQYFNELLR